MRVMLTVFLSYAIMLAVVLAQGRGGGGGGFGGGGGGRGSGGGFGGGRGHRGCIGQLCDGNVACKQCLRDLNMTWGVIHRCVFNSTCGNDTITCINDVYGNNTGCFPAGR
ncbi:uncharacterized protein [Procambarus clarkii]|uniref:uncharacterized protein n=1 Tax=Procambarus clarkii TaxID=6728 RepID=UPI003741FDC2